MKFGNRASLEEIPRKTEDVEFPEFDTFYRLREMSGLERDTFEASVFKKTTNGANPNAPREVDPILLRARLVALCLIDEQGELCYTNPKDLATKVSATVLIKLFTAAQKLNGLEPTAVEDAAKNSESALDGDSLSVSQGTSEKPLLNS